MIIIMSVYTRLVCAKYSTTTSLLTTTHNNEFFHHDYLHYYFNMVTMDFETTMNFSKV